MPLVEVGEDQLKAWKADYADADNHRKIWRELTNDPSTQMPTWEIFKKKYPNVPVKEYDTAKAASQPLLDRIEATEKSAAEKIEALEKRLAEREERDKKTAVDNTMAAAHRRLRGDGWDDEGIKKIEELMLERGVGDYDVAAAYVRSTIPKPAPLNAAYEGRDLNWFNPGDDEPDGKLLMENPRKFKADMTRKFLQDKANGDLRAWAA